MLTWWWFWIIMIGRYFGRALFRNRKEKRSHFIPRFILAKWDLSFYDLNWTLKWSWKLLECILNQSLTVSDANNHLLSLKQKHLACTTCHGTVEITHCHFYGLCLDLSLEFKKTILYPAHSGREVSKLQVCEPPELGLVVSSECWGFQLCPRGLRFIQSWLVCPRAIVVFTSSGPQPWQWQWSICDQYYVNFWFGMIWMALG